MSRASWKRFEVAVGHYIADAWGIHVRTGRDAHGGTQTASDLQWRPEPHDRWTPGVRGWSLDCKDASGLAVPTWLAQARDAAALDGNGWWAVVHKRRRYSIGDARVFLPAGMASDLLEHGEPDPDGYAVSGHSSTSLKFFCEVFK